MLFRSIDYLVKPVNVENLKKAVERFYQRSGTTTGLQNLSNAMNDEKLLKFKSYNGLFLLRPDDIAYVEADGNYACNICNICTCISDSYSTAGR